MCVVDKFGVCYLFVGEGLYLLLFVEFDIVLFVLIVKGNLWLFDMLIVVIVGVCNVSVVVC